jgi:F-type H+-transporting ATPase subunit delta
MRSRARKRSRRIGVWGKFPGWRHHCLPARASQRREKRGAKRSRQRLSSEIDVAEGMDGGASEAAARYAQAVFDLAKETGSVAAVEGDFAKFSEAWDASADLRAAARSPLIEPQEKAKALTAVAAKLGISDLGRKAIGVAAVNRRAAELPQIAGAFAALAARDRGARRIEIISARPLSAGDKTAIVEALGKKLGGKVEAETKVDESLIGGFIVRVGSRQFDASIKSKLDSLRLQLKSA